jgi:hypothetical protein
VKSILFRENRIVYVRVRAKVRVSIGLGLGVRVRVKVIYYFIKVVPESFRIRVF